MAVNLNASDTYYLLGYDATSLNATNGTVTSEAAFLADVSATPPLPPRLSPPAVPAPPGDPLGSLGGPERLQLNVPYVACEALVAVVAVAGNALVILAFQRERRLRRRTNYYIVSLAAADLLVGLLGIPFAVLASMGMPHNLHACLFTVSLLVVLCTISIFCLVAVSVDRYWAILHPLGYSRNVSTKKAIGE